MGISPDFPLGPLKVGFDLNYYVPMGDYDTPDSLDVFVLRHVSYDHEDQYGFRWGRLQRVTLGNGLLVDDFDSGSGGSSEFSYDKTGVLGYMTAYDVKVTAMATAQEVQALRLERPVFHLGDVPVIVGGTYITDADGIDDDSSGELIQRDEQEGYEVDVAYPIGGNLVTLYSEYAELVDQGKGASLGATGSVLDRVRYRAEYRVLGAGFVPSYYNSTYQATSFDFSQDSLTGKVSGFLVNADTSVMDGYIRLGAQYEHYDEIQLLSTALGWKKIGPTVGVLNLTKPFNSGDDRLVAVLDLYIHTNNLMNYTIRTKRVYESANDYEDSVSVGMTFQPQQLLPGLPF